MCVVCAKLACAVRVSEFAGLAHFSTQRQLCAVFGCVVVWCDADMWCSAVSTYGHVSSN